MWNSNAWYTGESKLEELFSRIFTCELFSVFSTRTSEKSKITCSFCLYKTHMVFIGY